MHDASRRALDVVLVWKLDRFGRSVWPIGTDLTGCIERLRMHGVRFPAVSQNIDTDESNPTSRLMPDPGRGSRVRAGAVQGAGCIWSGQRQALGQTAWPAKAGIRPRKSAGTPTAGPQLSADRAGACRWAGDGR